MFIFLLLLAAGGAVAAKAFSKPSEKPTNGPKDLNPNNFQPGNVQDDAYNSQQANRDRSAAAEQGIRDDAKELGSYVPVYGKLYAESANFALEIGKAIGNFFGQDLYKSANTPEQKQRLDEAIKKILSLGYPPPLGYVAEQVFGFEDIANRIESQISAIQSSNLDNLPLADLGTTILASVAKGDLTEKIVQSTLAASKSEWGMFPIIPIHIFYCPFFQGSEIHKPMMNGYPCKEKDYPQLDILAYAAMTRFGYSFGLAQKIIFDVINTYNSRRGWNDKNTVLANQQANRGDDRYNIIAEIWNAIKIYSASQGLRDRMKLVPIYSQGLLKGYPIGSKTVIE